jgi:hypothetical protein
LEGKLEGRLSRTVDPLKDDEAARIGAELGNI